MHTTPGHLEPRLQADYADRRTLTELVDDISCEVAWSGSVGGRALWVSGSVQHVCGFTPAEVLGTRRNIWVDRADPADVGRVEAAFRQLVLEGGPFNVEYRWQRRDGGWLWLRGRGVRRSTGGAPTVDAVFTDITYQKRLEDQVRQLQKTGAVGQFTGGIAHDFNNLLAVILANDTMLLDALDEGDPRRADAESIMDAALRAAALTRQLLAFTRQHAFEPRPLDVNEVVRGADKMLRRMIGEDVEFSMILGGGAGPVHADAVLLEQVLMNLVVNARDAMPHGGKLTIETSQVTHGQGRGDEADAAGRPAWVRLTVSDTGCGMDADTRRRAFEPFFTTKAIGHGTGLGLATSEGIVRQIGGEITIDSEPGRGSVFEVLLPIVRAPLAPAPLAAKPVTDEYAGTETILLVEDDSGVRALVQRMLGRLGYVVIAASDGQEALAAVHSGERPIDLVLCDVIMPDLSGPEVVSRVQARSRRTRALFMSGHTTHSLLQQGTLQAGHAFIHKPFMPSALARKIREVLDA